MTNSVKRHIFFVDDEPGVRRAVHGTLNQNGLKVNCFACAADCLKELHSQTCDLLITDVRMPGMNGLELLTEAKRIFPSLPILVISGYGDIPMAVEALKTGALDFIEKPLDRSSFLSAVESALKQGSKTHPVLAEALTKTETKVLHLLLDGKSTKKIAKLRHRSVRTIEDQRRNIMHKLRVDNLVDLVKRVAVVRVIDPPEDE